MKTVPIKVEPIGVVIKEDDVLTLVGRIAGECYNSSMDTDKCIQRALNCIKRGHHSPWEHINITLRCTVDRGVSHALVRHRHCAFQQSSTIYQKYDELTFIEPNYCDAKMLMDIEAEYTRLLKAGNAPSEARDILPNCLATNLIITTNIRQWMYMIQRRCGPGDSTNMHVWCAATQDWFMKHYPKILGAFDAWYQEHPL